MEFFRQYGNGLPFPSPGDFPHPETEPISPLSPALQADSLPTESLGKPIPLNVGSFACLGAEGIWEFSVSTPQFCCEPKTALKIINFKEALNSGPPNLISKTYVILTSLKLGL